jgi:glycosyltransferase involved in cell wall biosynthesis
LNFEQGISAKLLSQLPPPPAGKTGWPWTEESESIASFQKDGIPWLRISIITPSFNQGNFIEETIRSILLQNYPNLEYIIIDGGSSDSTLEIIRRYEPWITYWVSEKDSGQSDAINKGFGKCTGELVNWICSDDLLCPNGLNRFIQNTKIESNTLYLGEWTTIDEKSVVIKSGENVIQDLEMLVDISGFWRNGASIAQQSAFFPLQAVKKIYGLNTGNHYSMDYELWGKLLLEGCRIQNTPVRIGSFRTYPAQKTAKRFHSTISLFRASVKLTKLSELSFKKKLRVNFKNIVYLIKFIYHHLRSKIGIKRRIRRLWKKE